MWVADSALYNSKKLKNANFKWLTRAPNQVKLVNNKLTQSIEETDWQILNNGYKAYPYSPEEYPEQAWCMYFSQQTYQQALKTLNKKVRNALNTAQVALNKLCRTKFACEKDAIKAMEVFDKGLLYHHVNFTVNEVKAKRTKRGRPKKNQSPIIEYQLTGTLVENEAKLAPRKEKLGRFVLVTNDLSTHGKMPQSMLDTYKEQKAVENCFGFLKSDQFQLDHVFLKKPERINGLMMIMALSVLTYNAGQYLLRKKLRESDLTLPNQLGKEIQNPTLRWVFYMMRGTRVQHTPQNEQLIIGINKVKYRIIQLFGEKACEIYGIK